MKLIRFRRDMAPYHAGDTLAVPNAVADAAVAEGFAVAEDSAFDAPVRSGPIRYVTRGRAAAAAEFRARSRSKALR